MKLSLVSDSEPIARLVAEGKITAEDFREGQEAPLIKVLGPQWAARKVLLDLEKATYMDSSAIGWLLSCNKQFRQNGGKLVLHSVPPNIAQLFSLLKIGSTLSIAAKEPQALALATGAPQ